MMFNIRRFVLTQFKSISLFCLSNLDIKFSKLKSQSGSLHIEINEKGVYYILKT